MNLLRTSPLCSGFLPIGCFEACRRIQDPPMWKPRVPPPPKLTDCGPCVLDRSQQPLLKQLMCKLAKWLWLRRLSVYLPSSGLPGAWHFFPFSSSTLSSNRSMTERECSLLYTPRFLFQDKRLNLRRNIWRLCYLHKHLFRPFKTKKYLSLSVVSREILTEYDHTCAPQKKIPSSMWADNTVSPDFLF